MPNGPHRKLFKGGRSSNQGNDRPDTNVEVESKPLRIANVSQPRPKMGMLEALAAGVRVVAPQVKQEYKQNRGKQVSPQVEGSNVQSGQHSQGLTAQSETREFVQIPHGEPWPNSSHNHRLPANFSSLDPGRDQNFGRSPPVHMTPYDNAPRLPDLKERIPALGPQISWFEEPSFNVQNGYPPTDNPGLLRIQNIILRAGQDFKELQAHGDETAEQSVHRLINQYRELFGRLREAYQNLDNANVLRREHEAQSETLMTMQKELQTTKDLLRVRNTELVDKDRALNDNKRDMVNAERLLSEQLANNERELNLFNNRIQSQQYEHGKQIRAEQQKLYDEQIRLKALGDEQVRKARSEEKQQQEFTIADLRKQLNDEHLKWEARARAIEEGFKNRIRDDKFDSDRRLREQKKEYDDHIKLGQEKYDKMVTEYMTRIAEVKATTEEEKSRLREELQVEKTKLQDEQKRHKKELASQKANLTEKYLIATHALRSDNEELKQGLFERKHFKGLRDRDLTGKFGTIVAQVRDFSNLEWDSRRESNWPFTEHQLLEIHRNNIRKLKKQILQNSLWVLLYDHVFRTPFRILGIEGRDIDSDWFQIHAPNTSSLEWPVISPEAEEARRETARSFLAMLEPSATASGDALRRKKSFEDAISATIDALRHAIERVASVEERHFKILQSLVRLCATTWIEFCSQKYRLLVGLPKGSGDLLSLPKTHERTLTLVISPELKRYGNSEGVNLLLGEVVPNCQAAVQPYPTR